MFRTRRTATLIITLIAGQAIVLLVGLVGFAQWLERDLRELMREQVLATNRQMARQVSHLIEAMNLDRVKVGSADWRQLQDLVERIELPNDGFLCVTDGQDGRMLCHPRFREDPTVRERAPGMARLHGPGGGTERSILDAAKAQELTSGWTQMPDGTHMVAARHLPELDVQVLAHQKQAGIDAAVAPIVQRTWAIGGMVTVALLLGSGSVTTFLVRRYENRLARANAELEQRVEQRTHQLTETRDAVIFGLARLAESRDDDTGQHLERIGHYVELLAHRLKPTHAELTDCRIRRLKLAASLHDIGKVGVPDRVLQKPGKLEDDEWQLMKKHPIIGGDTLFAIRQHLESPDDFLIPACEIAFAHHERWDGTGYPFGLAGDQIPITARIVALADAYDALTTDRVYRAALPHAEAKRIILEGEGSHFDPAVVQAFREAEAAFQAAGDALSSDGVEALASSAGARATGFGPDDASCRWPGELNRSN